MEAAEVRKLVALEDAHWWYRERRALLARELRRLDTTPGVALDIGAAGGGNSRVLRAHRWRPVAVEYGAEGAAAAAGRGLMAVRADACHLPFKSGSIDLVLAFDVLEHIEEDDRAATDIRRVLRPGGTALIAVPCDMRLWSAHDIAVGHVRRYERDTLRALIEKAGLRIERIWSWNVLMRPAAARRRKRSTSSDLDDVGSVLNTALSMIIKAERYLPVRSLPGVSLVLRATRPE